MEGSVRKRGKKWYYSFETKDEKGKRKRVERVGGETKREAQDALREELNKLENLRNIKNMTFYQLLDFCFKEKSKTLKKATEKVYIHFIKKAKTKISDFKLKDFDILTFAKLKGEEDRLIVF